MRLADLNSGFYNRGKPGILLILIQLQETDQANIFVTVLLLGKC